LTDARRQSMIPHLRSNINMFTAVALMHSILHHRCPSYLAIDLITFSNACSVIDHTGTNLTDVRLE